MSEAAAPASAAPAEAPAAAAQDGAAPTRDEKKTTSADYYFDPKARYAIHEQMIKDPIRQGKLMKCIEQNADQFQDAVVLVLGCGLGLTSMQCARVGGAKKVVGVENSSIVHKAAEVAAENGLSDVCTFHKGQMDMDLPLEPNSVDIILCEWMSNILSNDPIAKQLIRARDKYLKKSGTIIPDKAGFYLTSCSDIDYKESSFDYWDNVYGFRMQPMKKLVLECPVVSAVPMEHIVTNAGYVYSLDAYTMTEADLDPNAEFKLVAHSDSEYVHYLIGFIIYKLARPGWRGFEVSAGPEHPTTHWEQTCFTLKEDLAVNRGDVVRGVFKMKTGEQRSDITISLNLDGSVHQTSYDQDFAFHHY